MHAIISTTQMAKQWLHGSEYAMEGIFSIKSDVYSFGVLILEVVTGTRRSSLNQTMGFPNLIAYVSICLLTSCKLKSLSSHYKPIRITTIKMVHGSCGQRGTQKIWQIHLL